MRRDIERLAAIFGNRAHHHLRYWRQLLALRLREVGESGAQPRVRERMLRDEALELALHFIGQRIVGGAHIGEFGVTSDRRDAARIKDRRARRQIFERAIGVPQPVTKIQTAHLAVLGPDFAPMGQVRDIDHFGSQAQFRIRPICANRRFNRSDVSGEREVLFLGEILIGKNQHRVSPERLLDRCDFFRIEPRARSTPTSAAKFSVMG